ncbi:uncharacterized protein LOC119186048 isoform X3 [Rhipicephalus microplus]|uniref:uncharacterized protein LOC119186048 isoform X3 n=1 Tax=Rhipicephalus microplus TaxID=6941 RepID=UPI003F6C242C
MKHHMAFFAVVSAVLVVLHPCVSIRNEKRVFYECGEKIGIVKNAKATMVATKLLEKCSFTIATKYKFSPRMIQTGYNAYSEAVYPCVAKMAPLLIVKLNPDFVDGNITNPNGLFLDGVKCAAKHNIFTDDVTIALTGVKWVLESFF